MAKSITVLAALDGLVSRDVIAHLQRVLDDASRVIESRTDWNFGEITCMLVPVDEICRLHREYFGDPSPTDIITFPYEAPGSGAFVDGDIAVCPDVVREQAMELGVTFDQELAFVAIHGLLHLAGWDDQTADQRAAMHDRQHAILREVFDGPGR